MQQKQNVGLPALGLAAWGVGGDVRGPPVVRLRGAEGAPASTGVLGLRGRDTLTQRAGCLGSDAPGGSERRVGGPWLPGLAGRRGRGARRPRAPRAGRRAPVSPPDEQNYLLRDAEAEVLFSFSLEESLKRAHVSPLFKVRLEAASPARPPCRQGGVARGERASTGHCPVLLGRVAGGGVTCLGAPTVLVDHLSGKRHFS